MTKITLNPVNYYDIADIYYFETDNRPLYDISNNIDILNTTTSYLGFYQEISANLETEPAGGFTVPSCAYQGANGLLYPIDISQPVTSIDYTQYPIYLVIKAVGSSKYQCLAFSASLTINTLFNRFISTSIGKAIKVGPGGSIVDEVTFDLYYGAYGYQNLYVGKVLTANTISFGGNQVSMLGDNRFLAKNADDSTLGLITRYVDNTNSSTSQKTVLMNNANSPYPFSEIIHQVGSIINTGSVGQSPVFFTSAPLTVDSNGSFTLSSISSILNEVHFASPVVSAGTLDGNKLGTAGVNFNSLMTFAQNFLLHAAAFSTNLQETTQILNTSLIFNGTSAVLATGLQVMFSPVSATFGMDSVAYSSVPSYLTSALQGLSNGISFGQYKQTGYGAFIGYVANSNVEASTSVIYTDSITSYAVSSLVGSSALSIVNKNSTSNAVFCLDTDYIIFNASVGAYYGNTASAPLEITNKSYVDAAVASATNATASKVPLAGTNSGNAITGSLFFNVTSNADSSTVVSFNTMLNTTVLSNNPITVYGVTSTGAQGTPQIVRGFTLPDGNSGYSHYSGASYALPAGYTVTGTQYANINPLGSDFVTRDYVYSYVSNVLSAGGAYAQLGTLGAPPADQTFYGNNLFTNTVTLNAATALELSSTAAVTITSGAPSITFTNSTPSLKLRYDPAVFSLINYAADISSDAAFTFVPRGYIDDQLPTIISRVLGPVIYGAWGFSDVNRSITVSKLGLTWRFPYTTVVPTYDHSDSSFSTYFTQSSGDNSLTFLGIPDPEGGPTPVGALFMVSISDSRINGIGALLGHQARTQTAIIVNDTVMARNLCQNDTGHNSESQGFLVGTTSTTSVYLQPNDKLYLLTEDADHACASIIRIR